MDRHRPCSAWRSRLTGAGIRPVRSDHRGRRRGVVTLWTLLCIPILVLVLVGVAEVNRLGQARVQLENALESAVLAAVQEWGDHGGGAKWIAQAQAMGKAYAQANPVQGIPVDLDDPAVASAVEWSFGTGTPCKNGYDFRPDPKARARLVVVLQATVKVSPLCRPVLGGGIGGGTVSAAVAAYYDPHGAHDRPRLIRLN